MRYVPVSIWAMSMCWPSPVRRRASSADSTATTDASPAAWSLSEKPGPTSSRPGGFDRYVSPHSAWIVGAYVITFDHGPSWPGPLIVT